MKNSDGDTWEDFDVPGRTKNWWSIHTETLIELMTRAQCGEEIDMLMLELLANSDNSQFED